MATMNSRFDHPILDETVRTFDALTKITGREDALAELQPAIDRWRIGHYVLVVVGEIKKGKSSFINGLLDCEELVPTGTDYTTSVVFKISYGRELRYRVFFLPDDLEDPEPPCRPPEPIAWDKIQRYGTETGNPGNRENVDFISVELPHPLLEAGLIIVDLPGLGGVVQEHALVTWRYVPSADGVFFIVDTESPLGRFEVESIKRLSGMNKRFVFLQTKIDTVGEVAWKAIMEENTKLLREKAGLPPGPIPYFPVSNETKRMADRTAQQKLLERSGFPAARAYLEDILIPGKRDYLAEHFLPLLHGMTLDLRRPVANDLAIEQTTSAELLQELQHELETILANCRELRVTILPQVLREFDNEFDHARDHAIDQIENELDPNPHAGIVGAVIGELYNRTGSANELAERATEIVTSFVDRCASVMTDISEEFDSEVRTAYLNSAQRINDAVPPLKTFDTMGREVAPPTAVHLPRHLTPGEQMAVLLKGGTQGSMVLIMAAKILVGLVNLPVMVFAGVMWLFGRDALAEMRRRQLREALEQLRHILTGHLGRIQRQARRVLEREARELQRDAKAKLAQAAELREAEMRGTEATLKERRERQSVANTKRLQELRDKLGIADLVLARLSAAGYRGQSDPA